jgi:hypothetical protein
MSGPHRGAVLSIGWVLLGVAAVPVFAEHRTPTGESDVVPRLGSQGASLTDDTPPPTLCSSGPCQKRDDSTRRDQSESGPHSLFVMEFTWPNTHRRAVLFESLTKCWTFGDYRSGSSMAGLSVSWKK